MILREITESHLHHCVQKAHKFFFQICRKIFFIIKIKSSLDPFLSCRNWTKFFTLTSYFPQVSQVLKLFILEHNKQYNYFQTRNLENFKVIVHCATREKKIYFASVKFDARAKRG